MKAKELAQMLLEHPEAEVVVNVPWESLAHQYLDDYERIDYEGSQKCAVKVIRLSKGWLPSGVLSIETGSEVLSG